MKLTLVLLITAFLQMSFAGHAQKITFTERNASIVQAFNEIQNQTGYKFLYTDEMLNGANPVDLDFKNASLADVLKSCFNNQPLTYTIKNKNIIVQRKIYELPQMQVAQAITIKGKVTDEKGESLPGVTVSIKGKPINTATNISGTYSINIPDGMTNAVLVFSFVGFETKEIPVAGQTIINVKLAVAVSNLNEVVVVGYGIQKKETLTGAVATVSAKVFQDRGPIDNPINALQGAAPGVVVTRSSAAPGRQGWNLQIRGSASVNGSDPLYIIDGVPISVPYSTNGSVATANGFNQNASNALSSLNPDDIESISILKDASAAIYGARAAAGVVLITTKRGKGGKPTIQYDGSLSEKIQALRPHLVSDGRQYGALLSQAVLNDFGGDATRAGGNLWYKFGVTEANPPASGYIDLTMYNGASVTPANNPLNPGFGDVKDMTFMNNNWMDVLFGNTMSTNHNLSLTGSGDKYGYRVSFNYLDDGSLLKWGDNSNKRYTLRLSHDYQISDRFKMGTTIAFEQNDIVQPTQIGNVLGQYQQPGFPIATLTGQPYAWGTQYSPNWQAALGGDNVEKNTRIYTNLNLNYKLSKHFEVTGIVGYNPTTVNYSIQQNPIHWYNYLGTIQLPDNPTQQSSFFQRGIFKDNFYNLNAYINYHNDIGKHSFAMTLGSAYEEDKNDLVTAQTNYQASPLLPSLNLGIGDNTTKSDNEALGQSAIVSYFGRVNYSFNGKYLLEGDFRVDGSSKFSPDNRYKAFYGISGGWIISNEKFLADSKIFDQLKLRLSYGSVGNQNAIGLYDYIQQYNVNSTTGAVNGGPPIIGSSPVVQVSPTSSLVANNRTWETLTKSNAALDFAFLRSRLSGTVEYYVNNNTNMLLPQILPGVLGATAPALNLGHLRTWGWDASLQWQDKIGGLSYHIGGNISDSQNKLINFGGANVISQGYNASVEGYPLNSYFGLQYAGRIQTQAQANAVNAMSAGNNIGMPLKVTNSSGVVTFPGVRPGDNMFRDVNGDGKLTVPGDLINLGSNDPRYTYGITLGGSFHSFDFNAIIQGVGKRTIFRSLNWRVPFGSIFQAQSNYWVGKTWTPDNTDAQYPILSGGQNGAYNNYNYQISDWSVENGAYLRLKNMTVGYTLPKTLTTKAGIQKIRVYFSGSDIFEFSHIKDGWDPEATRDVATGLQRYPFYRFFTGGLTVTL